ncbi:SAV_915 family protein [Streptacidiphilus sp. PB12-B1b]|uniref:SAV_915 family protein n=1 Tax=Streptacidiphilus sp. PB12-B1b TaxID=2705012 RepID=UPI001CDBB74F|nr:SAV_915 family protein [Streptacidiphilus sp. PB12-B1b]
MTHLSEDDAGPDEARPAGLLCVPVRSGPVGDMLRLFRTPLGGRTAVGFTNEQRLTAVLGPTQQHVELSASALRGLTAPLGVTELTIDPQLAAAPVAALGDPSAWQGCRASAASRAAHLPTG